MVVDCAVRPVEWLGATEPLGQLHWRLRRQAGLCCVAAPLGRSGWGRFGGKGSLPLLLPDPDNRTALVKKKKYLLLG